MYRLVLLLVLVPLAGAVAKDKGGDAEACIKGQEEVAAKLAAYQGDARIKQLIAADLKRAGKEQAEGDDDECVEAIQHAEKLLAGDY
jgi:hypothetical protein